MLSYLHVKNFALINELEIEFNKGLTVLTGETGAGKSIIIGSMNAISGNKLDKGIIRSGTEYALIEMIFEITDTLAKMLASKYEISFDEEHTLLISRKFNESGRSVYRINSEAVTASVVKEITEQLIDIHSQHDHQSLLKHGRHIYLLDQYIGRDISVMKEELKELYTTYKGYMKEIEKDALDDEHRRREMDFLKFEIDEIEGAELVIGEDEQLHHDYKLLSNQKKIVGALSDAVHLLERNPTGSINDMFSTITSGIASIKQYDDNVEDIYEEALQAEGIIRDLSRNIDGYLSAVEMDHKSIDDIEKRLHVINTLKSKYGDDLLSVLEVLNNKKEELYKLEHYDENIERIKGEIEHYEANILKLCGDISAMRQSAAKHISGEISMVLGELNFVDSKVEVEVKQADNFDATGYDQVTILISTNKNEPVQPLNKIASGGELSRVMLALKTVFAKQDSVGTMVFDEIDTGISGRTAQKVAEKMAALSGLRQLICITHLPQISAMADEHYLIEKSESGERIETSVNLLDATETYDELARLIGGAQITENTLNSAREMKELANALKNQ